MFYVLFAGLVDELPGPHCARQIVESQRPLPPVPAAASIIAIKVNARRMWRPDD
jgi:hypothetical protein